MWPFSEQLQLRHDGTVMVDTEKYRSVEIPPNGGEPPDVRLTRIR